MRVARHLTRIANTSVVGYAASNDGTPWANLVLAPVYRCNADHLLSKNSYVDPVAK